MVSSGHLHLPASVWERTLPNFFLFSRGKPFQLEGKEKEEELC